jgi:HEXXH motif-containing protein
VTGSEHSTAPTTVRTRHHLTQNQLDALTAGRHDTVALDELRRSQLSRRLLLLRSVLRYARASPDCTGPLPAFEVAWQLLADAQRRDADVVLDVLGHPQVGMWAAHVLRRFRGSATDPAPLWFHVGYLHALAAAAAIRVGLSFRLAIPCRDGDVVLPTLGSARVDDTAEWGVVEIRSVAGKTELVDGAGWRPMTALNDHIRLDDIDPYRGLDNPVRPEPLPAAEIGRWHELFAAAWGLLAQRHPDQAAELAAGMRAVVPLRSTARFRIHSASVENGYGGALMSRPPDAEQLAVTLVHEFQHSKLAAVQHLVQLLVPGSPAVHHAPWRDDPRPPTGLLQGVFAFTAVTEFWAEHLDDNPLAQFEFAHWRDQTVATLETLRTQPDLTELGRRFLDGIATRLEPLAALEVPADIDALAHATAVDHVASWQVRHLRPEHEFVGDTVSAWLAGGSAPTGYTARVVPATEIQRLDVKAVLSRVRITEPTEFDALRATPWEIDGAAAGDFAVVAGDSSATSLYLSELAADPRRAGAWSGLGLSLAAKGSAAADALTQRPELVHAVYLEAIRRTRRAPDIEELAAWLTG